ncbi:hypothetical protein PYW07_008931 [Mythimna separata]|uniref:Uncharacterized protein n=1 Tax=Mythimna separata TaxID=271217 RepID=A0AAD8DMS4_MYTSE|nr:hypothetical protein PYW07_008931 [Mythimna separata]
MKSILISIFFAFVAIPYNGETKPSRRKVHPDLDEDFTADRESQFNCFKLKSCTPGGPKVCGYDQDIPWLVEFEDMCTLYKTNCKENGKFYPVDHIVCDTRINYDKEHANETFEVIHIRPTADTNKPVVRNAADAATRVVVAGSVRKTTGYTPPSLTNVICMALTVGCKECTGK